MTPAGGRGRERKGRNYAIGGLIGVAVVATDLFTKRWASSRLGPEPVDVLGDFLQVRYVENTGAAFSMFQDAGPFFGVAAVIAVGVVLWFLRGAGSGWEVVGLGLVMGGAAGNLVDRIARGDGLLDGPVIDWVNLWFIPTFNVADASITCAVAVLLIGSWLND
jgi:signal peptidase II